MDRLVSSINKSDKVKVTSRDDTNFVLRASADRIFPKQDEIVFKIENDGYVLFTSKEVDDMAVLSDIGEQQKRLEKIRLDTDLFRVMGDDIGGDGTVDAVGVITGTNGRDPVSQLRAFYGQQSGTGYEDLLTD